MPTTRKSKRFETQAAELAFAVPQVITHRLTRMAFAGHTPNARDRREFHKMGAEKMEAFYESWMAMMGHAWQTQYSLMLALCFPWLQSAGSPSAQSLLSNFTQGMMGKGMEPVHKRAVANAKRLARTRIF